MKSFIIFFSIVLIIYSSANFYIFIRGWQAIPRTSGLRMIYLSVFIFLSSSYIIGRILERFYLSSLSEFFIWTGAYWLALIIYFLLSILLIDFFRLINHYSGFFPSFINNNYSLVKQITAAVVILVSLSAVFAGRVNAVNPRTKNLTLKINKNFNNGQPVKIFMASDLHLGTLIGNSRLDHLVDHINSFNADAVVFAGDIVDEDIGVLIKENLGKKLRLIKSKFGVFSVPGNHEYFGGIEETSSYLSGHGIHVLRDETVKINNSFYLVGRDDITKNRITKRASIPQLLEGLDSSLPLVVLDHQPFHLEEAEKAGVDLQLSGHTHHGQIWPFNYITDMIYEVSWGYKLKHNTHIYVSSGFGGWGPPIRLGSQPEVVEITLIPAGK